MADVERATEVGAVRIWRLSDGTIQGSAARAGQPAGRLPVNAFLVESDGRRILVDTGLGDKWLDLEPDLERPTGNVLAALRRAGFVPADIDTVVNTHLHVDHAGGDTDRHPTGGITPTFPRAEYIIQAAEWSFASEPPVSWMHLFRQDDFRPLEMAARLRLIDGACALTEAVSCIPAPGHTPGHQGVRITSDGHAAMIVGDAIADGAAIRSPSTLSDGDVDPERAAMTRESLLSWATEHDATLGLAHAGAALMNVHELAAATPLEVGP
jgi:glyoxylase-like metal-dependent hydrolase (beta-lactamase superfamily II)